MTSRTNDENDIEERLHAWRERGFTVEKWALESGDAWTDEGHPGDEFILLLEGDLEVVLDEAVVKRKVGEHIFIPAGTRHTVRNVGTGPLSIYWAHEYEYDGTPADYHNTPKASENTQ